jgi:hypothetical protein
MHGLATIATTAGMIAVTVVCYRGNAAFAMAVEPGASGSIRQAFARTAGEMVAMDASRPRSPTGSGWEEEPVTL